MNDTAIFERTCIGCGGCIIVQRVSVRHYGRGIKAGWDYEDGLSLSVLCNPSMKLAENRIVTPPVDALGTVN